MKGIILAGGSGTRLFPVTQGTSKQLLPVHDKPMIYYPLSTLMLADIQDVLLISIAEHHLAFKQLLGDGSRFGLQLSYAIQEAPQGIAHAFIVAEQFIANEPCCLILGDNIFYGHGLTRLLHKNLTLQTGAAVFAYHVNNPQHFGVIEFNQHHHPIAIAEKPQQPKSNWITTGLYCYDNTVVARAKQLKPSKRGELEITCLNNQYLREQTLKVELLGRGFAWLDAGTVEQLNDASTYIKIIEQRQNFKIACLEEIAWQKGWITKTQLAESANKLNKTGYGQYLQTLLNQDSHSLTPQPALIDETINHRE